MKKSDEAGANRQMVALRPAPDLRAQLEAAAEETGRPISKEAEWRLAQSFSRPNDPLPGIFSDEIRRVLRGSPAFAHMIEAVADATFNAIRAANQRNRSEFEVRIAARAALNAVADRFLWRPDAPPTTVEGDKPVPGSRMLDYPPAELGYAIAQQRLIWLSTWNDDDAALDADHGRVRDHYSGNGRTVLYGPTPEETDAENDRVRDIVAEKGEAAFDVENLHRYRAVERFGLRSEDLEGETAPLPLKDIMGR